MVEELQIITSAPASENNYASYHWENGIVVVTFKKIYGTLEAAKGIVRGRLKFTNNKLCPIIADIRAIIGTEKIALDYFDCEEAMKGVTATAIITESFISKFLANTFLRLNNFQKKIPTRMCNNKAEAIKWLEQYK
jgi:hypothetical protein